MSIIIISLALSIAISGVFTFWMAYTDYADTPPERMYTLWRVHSDAICKAGTHAIKHKANGQQNDDLLAIFSGWY